jgi:TolB-like protein/Flp pilus assembly protein TadD
MPAIDPPRGLRFGVFEVDLRTGRLTKRGLRRGLQEQPFKVLVMLLERSGELVSREELRERLWSRTLVDFDHGINKAVSKIREALGDSAANPRFVETVAGRGYRFLADVAPIEVALRRKTKREIRSLVVLPLQDLSGGASPEYFADSLTDQLITTLGQVGVLRVISRTSAMAYKGTRRPLPEIARELNVEAVLEGSVVRTAERIRITVQLVDAADDRHIWARGFEEDIGDMMALQNRIAHEVAERVQVSLSLGERAALAGSKRTSPKAYEAYLKGRYFWNKRTDAGLRRAVTCFEEAVATDPSFAEAHAGLADSYALLGDWQHGTMAPRDAFPKARDAAARALALDERLGEAHASLAFALDLYFWDWVSAEREHQRAISLNPGYATAHHWYGWHLMLMGRHGEAMAELRTAESFDPLSLIIGADLADALCITHHYDDSIAQSQKTLELDPNFALGHYQLGQAFQQKGLHDAAIDRFRQAIALAGNNAAFVSNLAYAYGISGRKHEAVELLRELQEREGRHSSAAANIALAHLGLGDLTEAMAWLHEAYEARFNPSILMRPAFDPLRADQRFQGLRRSIGMAW